MKGRRLGRVGGGQGLRATSVRDRNWSNLSAAGRLRIDVGAWRFALAFERWLPYTLIPVLNTLSHLSSSRSMTAAPRSLRKSVQVCASLHSPISSPLSSSARVLLSLAQSSISMVCVGVLSTDLSAATLGSVHNLHCAGLTSTADQDSFISHCWTPWTFSESPA